MKQLMSSGNFKKALVAFYGHAKITGPMLQDLIEDALLQAHHPKMGGHGSLNRLTMVIHACQQVKTIPTRTVQRYIQQWADVKWCKLDDGTMGFKYNGSPDASLPDVSWYEWEGNQEKNAKVDVDVVAQLKRIKQQVDRAHKKDGKVEHEELLPEIDKLIRKATSQVHTEDKPVAVEDY